jgi:tungstate transport system ATP-binding protein
MNALLRIDRLHKRFGQRPLLAIEALRIERASAYVLTGANGTGKSTLLRILAGLETADLVQLQWQGVPHSLRPYPRLLRDAIVYVHQHPVMFTASVAANIGYGLRMRGIAPHLVAERVEEASLWAGVAHLAARRADTLSGGEKQRVALARARILRPQLLLLDEPSANLDGAAREQVIALIPTLMQEGSSVIMACHDRDLIGLPAVQRLKLRDGKIELR